MKRDHLYLRHGVNDLVRDRGVNLALTTLLVLTAFLMATGAMVMERTLGSVDALFEVAKPPHFLQMHTGDYDADALAAFAEERPEVESWLIEDMVGFDGSAISWRRPSTTASGDLSTSLVDNLFVSQNEDFDLLLDGDGAVPRPSPGQVYVPVAYQQELDLKTSDELVVRTDAGDRALTVAGFVRDAQMASSLSSATRFLLAKDDLTSLKSAGGGDPEIIVEYRLTDVSLSNGFATAYESQEALPKNGQAVTYPMIRLINAFSDGLVALALVFVSGLLMVIALLALRFVVRGSLEDDVRQIGVMKAIGLPRRAITALYLAKYSVMTLVACALGGLLAVGASRILTGNVAISYAQAPVGPATLLVPLAALLLVYLVVIALCLGVLRGIARVEVVGALVHASTLGEAQSARRAHRRSRRARRTDLAAGGGSMNRRLALLDLRADARQWVLVPVVLAIATVLVTLPANLLTTFQSPRFVTYMGAPESDLRADVQFSDDVEATHADLLSRLEGDERVTQVRDFAKVLYETPGEEGWEVLRVEVGDHSAAGVQLLEGSAPGEGQIALSVANAERFDLSPGDAMPLRRGAGAAQSAVVSGIYQDVTSGGRTAKMQGQAGAGAVGYVLYADAVGGADPGTLAREYENSVPSATVIPMREYVQQTLSYVTNALRSAAALAGVFGVGVVLLITTLFLRLRLARERSRRGVLTAIGFSTREIISQVRLKVALSVVVGTAAGAAVAATAGGALVGGAISLAGLGIARLDLVTEPWLVWVVTPAALVVAGYVGTLALTARLDTPDKSAWLRG